MSASTLPALGTPPTAGGESPRAGATSKRLGALAQPSTVASLPPSDPLKTQALYGRDPLTELVAVLGELAVRGVPSDKRQRVADMAAHAKARAEDMESDLKLALDRVAQQEEEMAELSDSAHTSIKRTLVHKNRTAYLERQLDKVARRCERLQGELDGAVRDRRQAQSKLMTTTALGRTTSTSSGGAGGPAAASRAADAAVMAAIKERGYDGSAEAVIVELRRKLHLAYRDIEGLRAELAKASKERSKMEVKVKTHQQVAEQSQERLRIQRESHETMGSLRKRIKDLEGQLQAACNAQVRIKQRARVERQQQMWERLERDMNLLSTSPVPASARAPGTADGRSRLRSTKPMTPSY